MASDIKETTSHLLNSSIAMGKEKRAAFRFNADIGIWKKYDSNGKVVKETDHGEILTGLKN